MESLVGKDIGSCHIVSMIGKGAMGTVFKAYHKKLDIDVAVKVIDNNLIRQDPAFVDRFYREAQQAAKLNHQNIMRVYDIGKDNELYYIIAEYIDGPTLKQILKKEKKLLPEIVVPLILQALDGLIEAHHQGILHRDIKPDNLMINSRGVVKITDFGLARPIDSADPTLTNARVTLGTPAYMSLEQWQQGEQDAPKLDERADIYSLGVTLFNLLTGSYPYKADTQMGILKKIYEGERINFLWLYTHIWEADLCAEMDSSRDPAKRQEIWNEILLRHKGINGISVIIDKMTALNRNDRYPSMIHVKNDLAKYISLKNAIELNTFRDSFLKLIQPLFDKTPSHNLMKIEQSQPYIIFSGQSFSIIDKPITVGRSNECTITIKSHKVSTEHCKIYPSSNGIRIKDLRSVNGTKVNGQRISKSVLLKDGDIIMVAGHRIIFHQKSDMQSNLSNTLTKPKLVRTLPKIKSTKSTIDLRRRRILQKEANIHKHINKNSRNKLIKIIFTIASSVILLIAIILAILKESNTSSNQPVTSYNRKIYRVPIKKSSIKKSLPRPQKTENKTSIIIDHSIPHFKPKPINPIKHKTNKIKPQLPKFSNELNKLRAEYEKYSKDFKELKEKIELDQSVKNGIAAYNKIYDAITQTLKDYENFVNQMTDDNKPDTYELEFEKTFKKYLLIYNDEHNYINKILKKLWKEFLNNSHKELLLKIKNSQESLLKEYIELDKQLKVFTPEKEKFNNAKDLVEDTKLEYDEAKKEAKEASKKATEAYKLAYATHKIVTAAKEAYDAALLWYKYGQCTREYVERARRDWEFAVQNYAGPKKQLDEARKIRDEKKKLEMYFKRKWSNARKTLTKARTKYKREKNKIIEILDKLTKLKLDYNAVLNDFGNIFRNYIKNVFKEQSKSYNKIINNIKKLSIQLDELNIKDTFSDENEQKFFINTLNSFKKTINHFKSIIYYYHNIKQLMDIYNPK